MPRMPQEYVIWSNVTPVAVTSSTDATPIVVTATSHGFVTGQQVMIFGHTTNVAANGLFEVYGVTTNTFKLRKINGQADVAGSGAGAGSSGVVVTAPKVIFSEGYKSIQFELETSGSANFTMSFLGSFGPMNSETNITRGFTNFGATQSSANPWSYIGYVDLQTGSFTDGATGVVSAGTDLHKTYEVNVNGGRMFCPIISAWSAGTFSLKARVLPFGD